MKNKLIMVFATLMLFTACSNTTNRVIKKEVVKVSKIPTQPVEYEEVIIVEEIEAPIPPVGGDDSLPPEYYERIKHNQKEDYKVK